MERPNITLGRFAKRREFHILQILYRKKVALSLAQIMSMLPYPNEMTGTAMQDLIKNSLIEVNDQNNVYYLSPKGKEFVRYYESARDLV